MSNPLVAARVDSTQAFTGAPLLESAGATAQAIAGGDWAAGVMGAAGTALDALGMAMDPIGSIFAAGVGWLIEHVGPLSDALDALTGDPDQIRAHAETWANISAELGYISADLAAAVEADTAAWTGASADGYRGLSIDMANLIAAAQTSANGAASGISMAGEVVAAVRTLVRDIIAELVGRLIAWALEVAATLGLAMAWVVPQVVGAVATTATKIARLTTNLVQAMAKLGTLLAKLSGNFGDIGKALKRIEPGNGGGSTTTSGFTAGPGAAQGGVDLPGSSGAGLAGGGGRPAIAGFVARRGSGAGGGGPVTSRSAPGGAPPDLGGGAGPGPATGPAGAAPRPPADYDYTMTPPARPFQPPPGGAPAIPSDAHNHVTYGEVRPGRRPQLTGGHVWHTDIHHPVDATGAPTTKPVPGPGHHPLANGVTGAGPGGVVGPPKDNGVYEIVRPNALTDAGRPIQKPFSTMFPSGIPSTAAHGMGNQAWNMGSPNGGRPMGVPFDPPGGGPNIMWHGQAQIPFTPYYNPGHPDHGSGDAPYNHPNAGQTINIDGYATPGGNEVKTYFPIGTVEAPHWGFLPPDPRAGRGGGAGGP